MMANIRALTIFGFLVAFSSRALIAMPPQDVRADVGSGKATTDDTERLKCFDGLFGSPAKPKNAPDITQTTWSIDETKSPTDGIAQVIAANLVGDTVFILRCKDQTTEAAFSTQFNYLGYKS